MFEDRPLAVQLFRSAATPVVSGEHLKVMPCAGIVTAHSHQIGNHQRVIAVARQNLSAQLVRQWRDVVGVAQLVQLKRRRVVVKDRFHEVFIGDERPVGKPGNPVTVIPEQAGTQPLRKNHVI